MKFVFLSLFCYDKLFVEEINSHPENPDYFDEIMLSNHADPVHKWCKMLLMQKQDIEFWYLTCLQKTVKVFQHMYGHRVRRIPGFQLKKRIPLPDKISKRVDCDISFKIFKELKANRITHVLLSGYLLNKWHFIDISDLVISYCVKEKIKIYPIYGGDTIAKYGFIKRNIKLLFLRKSTGFFSQSKLEMELMVEKYKFPAKKMIYFNNPLDLDNFHTIPQKKSLDHLGLKDSYRYLLFIGRLEKSKGIHHLINIFPKLLKKFIDIRLLIAGRGSYEKNLKSISEKLNLKKEIIFNNYIQNNELKYLYNIAEILVLPSYAEGTPNVLLEAIACNTICLATEVGGIPDILSNGVGKLIPPKEEKELFAAIDNIFDNGFEINQIRRKEILDEIDINKKSIELVKIIKGNY